MDAAVETVYRNDEIMLQSMLHLDELLQEEFLPPCPFLHREFCDIASIDEIRRTLVAANIDENVSDQELLNFFGNAGEVKYIRFCMRKNDPLRYCLVEFSSLISIVNGLKLNNHILHGKMIKVYHSVEAIEKPSYLKEPESFMQYLLELKSHVEDSYKIVQKAAKDVCEYEEYCSDNQPPSKSPLKNVETAIAEIEEALSKVLSAQSLMSVAISPVESDLLSMLGETMGHKEPIPSSPESFLKYINQKRDLLGQEDLTNSLKKEPVKSSKLYTKILRRKHRSRSSERKDKYHSHSAGSSSGKSSLHHEERSKSNDNRSRRHAKHGSSHCPLVSSDLNRHSASEISTHSAVLKSKGDDQTNSGVNSEPNEASQAKRAADVKSIHKVSSNESEKENDDQERKDSVSNSEIQTSTNSHEKIENLMEKYMEEDSIDKSRHQTPYGEHHSHSESRSRSYGGRRRSSRQREHHKSPILCSSGRSPPSCERERRRISKRGPRSPSLDHHYRHHHRHHRSSWSWHSAPGDHTSRAFVVSSSSHGERRRRVGTQYSSRRSAKEDCVGTPREHHRSGRARVRSTSKDKEVSREKRGDRHPERALVRVCPESFEDYLGELDGELGVEKDAQSSQSEDVGKTETASGGSSQNCYSANGAECEDKEGNDVSQ